MMTRPEALHPLRIVVQRTGLTPDIIRVWERRYGVVRPGRSAGRHRMYSDAEIERLRLLARLTAAGRSIGRLASLSSTALAELVADDDKASSPPVSATSSLPPREFADALAAIARFDAATLEQTLRHAALRLGADEMIDVLIAPLITEIGVRWHTGAFTPANEHMATAVIRSTLAWMLIRASPDSAAPDIVVATPTGQVHELGGLIAAVTASTHGWRVTYLGANLPFNDIIRAAERVRARAIALSVVHPRDDQALADELASGLATLPSRFAVVVGGASAPSYASAIGARATLVDSIAEFRRWLRRAA